MPLPRMLAWVSELRSKRSAVVSLAPQAAPVSLAKASGAINNRIKYGLQIVGRAGYV
jgi:hypothetical protein